jgi:Phosphotransferase enzyme family
MAHIPRIAASIDELVDGASSRVRVDPEDGKSGSTFELVTIDGERYFLKTLSARVDWIMRVTGDRDLRTFRLWEAGIMDATPPSIDHAVVGMAREGDDPEATLAVLMADIGPHLVPEGDDAVTMEVHRSFVDHLAELCATHWGWRDELGLTSIEDRLRFFAPDNIAAEASVDDPPGAIRAAVTGWQRLPGRDPLMWALASRIHERPSELADALRSSPQTFLHGDWKMGNLGRHPDGRTILLDWAYPGAGPACLDLGWYLALNAARIPETKEAAIDAFRERLRDHGIDDVDGWFDAQLDVSLLAIGAPMFGWEKALGSDDELAWWGERARRGARRLGWD